jgi:hypothetical protein
MDGGTVNHAISCGVVLTEHHRVMIGWAFVRVVVSEQCISVISFRRTKMPDTESEYLSKCCNAELRTEPENPGRGETSCWICTECDEVTSPVKRGDTDE